MSDTPATQTLLDLTVNADPYASLTSSAGKVWTWVHCPDCGTGFYSAASADRPVPEHDCADERDA